MGQEENKPGQDDQAWFDALSGKDDSGQGARLRRVLREAELMDASQEETVHDWHRLQFALRREDAEQAGTTRVGWRYFALAASVLILAGVVTMLMPRNEVAPQSRTEGAEVMRGKSAQVIMSTNPEQEAKQLESELLHLGVKIDRRSSAEKIELNIIMSYPVKDDVRAVLEARIIPVPDHGDLSVVYMKSRQ
jgi:hypothetical protein